MGKPHAQRKSEIIQSALNLAAEQGVKKVTTQAIADRVGIAQATVFRHFQTRDLIFTEAIEWLAGKLFETVAPYFDDHARPADERLRLLIKRQLHFISQNRGLPRVLFSDRLHIESPALKGVVRLVMKRYTDQVAGLINEGIATGCFSAMIDAEKIATMITALVQGSVMRWSIMDFSFNLEEEAEPMLEFLNYGLNPRR